MDMQKFFGNGAGVEKSNNIRSPLVCTDVCWNLPSHQRKTLRSVFFWQRESHPFWSVKSWNMLLFTLPKRRAKEVVYAVCVVSCMCIFYKWSLL